MWFRKKQLESEEYLKLLHKIREIAEDVEVLTTKINLLQDKRWGKNIGAAKERETENLKSNDGLDMLRGINSKKDE